jgi:soluble lytic murein transglycosylase
LRWTTDAASGEGHALLARALLELGRASEALTPARRAVTTAPERIRDESMVTLARAHDRLGRADSAAHWYLRAAQEIPAAADWLRLRAAPYLADSADRAAQYRRIDSPDAQARIPWSEALALERTDQRSKAAARYDALGDRLASIRLRLRSGDSAARAAARNALIAHLANPVNGDPIAAIGLFDREIRDPTAAEELRAARRAAAAGLSERAAAGVAKARGLGDSDRLAYATALTRLGRYPEALPLYEAIRSPSVRPAAAYERARTLLRSGQTQAAIAALATLAEQHADNAEWAARALFLQGDLVGDRAGDDTARAVFRVAFQRYPAATFGRRAGFQAALMAYIGGNYATAAAEFTRLAAGPETEERTASLFWAGKALERSGDSAAARQRWQSLLQRDADSYYAVLVSRRTGSTPWRFTAPPAEHSVAIDPALERAAVLERLGLDREAGFVIGGFSATGSSPSAMVEAARSLNAARYYGRSVRLAMRAQGRGASWNRELAELLYPLPFRDVLASESQAAGVDPLMVASLIRQESAFEVRARSPADARGLMQILPSVGASYASRLGLAPFEPALLYQPDLNLDFGIEHLAEALARFGGIEQALAAYNAGADRVIRWLRLAGAADDAEVFVERIPFTETRDYVRRVLRNHAMYRALYATAIP